MKSEDDAAIEIIIELAIKILIIFTCLYFESVFIYIAYAIYSIGFLCFCMLPSRLNIGYKKLIVYLICSIKIDQKLIELVLWFSFKWFINNDELVEVTPLSIRIRKKNLSESDRKRAHKD